MSPLVVLITGANRGIGRGLLELYLQRPNHILIAANRDPSDPTSQEIASLPRAEGTVVHVIKNDSTVPTGAAEAVKQLGSLGIDHLDIVIANAGVAYKFPLVRETTPEDLEMHMAPNVYGFLRLFQATLPLLQAAKSPKWVTIGSSAAFLTVFSPPSYGALTRSWSKLIEYSE
jgi:NAD(P)-dependent dehydrogenase (short-subunit alcohol dehydrogenase family)